jgi:hypothetical protein
MGRPDFVVVGASKCGTTTLFAGLRRHPGVFVPARKELHHFSAEELRAAAHGPGDANAVAGICATEAEYAACFAAAGPGQISGDVSPSYFFFGACAERIAARLGGVRIIIMLRDPVEKAYSQYMHLVREGRETLDFERALAEEDRRTLAGWSDMWRYRESGFFADRVARYLRLFGRERVHVILLEDLARDPAAASRDLQQFLGLQYSAGIDLSGAVNRTGESRFPMLTRALAGDWMGKRVIKRALPQALRMRMRLGLLDLNTHRRGAPPSAAREVLQAAFAPDIEELEHLLGHSTGWRVR